MERIPTHPPIIQPLTPGNDQPVISVMIPVYNCSEYMLEAIESVLEQDLGEDKMQIEVVDDASTDADVSALVLTHGKGRVKYYRQKENVGSLRNFETCINRANGKYIHILHGDDKVKNGFYSQMLGLLNNNPEAGAAFCAFDMIGPDSQFFHTSERLQNDTGIVENGLYHLARRPWLQYACIVVKRTVYEQLGAFCLATYGEDWEMWVRIAKHYQVVYTPQALGVYRVHPESITRRSYITGDNMRDLQKIINRISEHLPEEFKEKATKEARKYWAYASLSICYSLWYRTHDRKVVLVQITEAMKLYRDPYLMMRVAILRGLMLLPQSWLPVLRKAFRPVKAST